MNKDLAEMIVIYATKPHVELSQFLINKSKDNLISMLTDLATAYINDKNSSSLREFITVSLAGYEHSSKKLGYNGYKHQTGIGEGGISCEAKPKNIITEGYDTKKSKPKFDGKGGFNDYTPERLAKDRQENPNILSSGFVDGELLYIVEFSFVAVAPRLHDQLPEEREVGTYTRMANFSFVHWQEHPSIRIVYKSAHLSKHEKYFNKKFYSFLVNSHV